MEECIFQKDNLNPILSGRTIKSPSLGALFANQEVAALDKIKMLYDLNTYLHGEEKKYSYSKSKYLLKRPWVYKKIIVCGTNTKIILMCSLCFFRTKIMPTRTVRNPKISNSHPHWAFPKQFYFSCKIWNFLRLKHLQKNCKKFYFLIDTNIN